MTKAKTKLMVTLMSVIACVCLMFATATMRPTYADGDLNSVSISNFTMYDGASIRPADADSNNKIGLRFLASMEISDEDFALLKANEDSVTFGMIIAPSDIVNKEGAPEFKLGATGWSEASETNKTGFVYANVEAFPQLDANDLDKDGVKTDYVLICSLVDIDTYNISRPFTARAYYQIGTNAVVHTEETVERAIYTIASKSIWGELVRSSTNPEMYTALKEITDTVETYYTVTSKEISGENITFGETVVIASHKTPVTIKGYVTNSDTGKVLQSGYRINRGHSLTNYDASWDYWLGSRDVANDTYSLNGIRYTTSDQANAGDGKGAPLYFQGPNSFNKCIYFNVLPTYIIANIELEDNVVAQNLSGEKFDITIVDEGEVVKYPNDKIKVSVTGAEEVSNGKLVDISALKIDYTSDNAYKTGEDPDGNPIYKTEYSIEKALPSQVYVNRTIEYGKYMPEADGSYEFKDAYKSDGTTLLPASTFDHAGIKAAASLSSTIDSTGLMIKGIELDSSDTAESTQLIRFQAIPTNIGYYGSKANTSMYGPGRIYITIIDADDPTNFVSVCITTAGNSSATTCTNTSKAFARASNWVNNKYSNLVDNYIMPSADKYAHFAATTNNGTSGNSVLWSNGDYGHVTGWGSGGIALKKFSLSGLYLTDTTLSNENKMAGISIKGSKIYVTHNGTTTMIWDFCESTKNVVGADTFVDYTTEGSTSKTRTDQPFRGSEDNLWYGFGKTKDTYVKDSSNLEGEKVNICISSYWPRQSQNMNYLLIDTIGGVQITETNANDFINNMSYVYLGNYLVPRV